MSGSGQPSSTSHHTQATSSSVTVQSNQPEEGASLTSLSDLHHPSISTVGAGSISSVAQFKLHHSHVTHTPTLPHFPPARTPIHQASSSSASSPVLSPSGKTIGRNNNGTSKFNHYFNRIDHNLVGFIALLGSWGHHCLFFLPYIDSTDFFRIWFLFLFHI